MTIVDEFANYAQGEAGRALPPEVTHHAKRALIDWFSALFPGIAVAPGVQLMKTHAAELGHGKSSLPGQRTTAFPATAAWINGSISHAVEFDDIFRDAVYHPGCPTISAALAVAEDRGASGAELLKAITVGYEISTRIGAAVQPSHYRFFHTTGTVGCFGSAAATAALAGPGNPDVMKHALATAATFASGLQQAFRSDAMTKALHAGHAGWVGVTAGLGAANGITGALDILEGAAGFGAATSQAPNWERATEGLGTRYNICSITQKNHGCCGHTFAAIDAMLAIREQGVNPQQVESIQVHTYQTALDVTGNFNPRTAFEAKFSLPYVVSHGLLYGAVRLHAAPGGHRDPRADGEGEAPCRPGAHREIPERARGARHGDAARRPRDRALRALPQGRPGSAAHRRRPERQVHRARVAGDRRRRGTHAARAAVGRRAPRPRRAAFARPVAPQTVAPAPPSKLIAVPLM
jgi:2-methylcitrate dehydratase PrpD